MLTKKRTTVNPCQDMLIICSHILTIVLQKLCKDQDDCEAVTSFVSQALSRGLSQGYEKNLESKKLQKFEAALILLNNLIPFHDVIQFDAFYQIFFQKQVNFHFRK